VTPAVLLVEAGGDAGELERALAELRVGRATLAELDRLAPLDAIAVIAMVAPADATIFTRVLAWADRRATRPGLIACIDQADSLDVETALAAGLDDAIPAAISARELVARVRAVARRVRRAERIPEHVRFGPFVLALGEEVVWIDGAPRTLSRGEFALLRALIAAGGAAMTRAALLDAAWGARKVGVGERAVDNVILNLRRILGPARIVTVRGVGFRLAR